MTDIEQILDELRVFNRERDWDQFHNGKDLAIGLSVEASELLEAFLWKAPDGKMRSGWIGGKSGFRAGPKKVIAILSRVLLKAFLPCSWRRTLREDAGGAI